MLLNFLLDNPCKKQRCKAKISKLSKLFLKTVTCVYTFIQDTKKKKLLCQGLTNFCHLEIFGKRTSPKSNFKDFKNF